MDTAVVLQIRDGLDLLDADLTAARGHLADLARRYRDTPMAGRTHLQHALPITFGYKAAIWLSALDRHAERLTQLRPRVLVVQFGGAAGTLASLGEGAEIVRSRTELAHELKLGDPPITWHVARDGIAETVQALALLAGSLGKIAYDVMLMSATEFGEAAEPFVAGRGSSSTMPQKRNPISCEMILAAAKVLRQQSGLVLDALVTDFERATGPWHVEWVAVRWRAAPVSVSARRPDRRSGANVPKPRHDPWVNRRRGGDDGPRPTHRTQRSARSHLRRLQYRNRK
jgi:3-carboxy-cis,cis-muconate cycloisomerase